MRAKTTLTADGKRINWSQVTHIDLKREGGVLIGRFKWKYKASIKTEEVALNLKDTEIAKYFKHYNFAPLTNDLYINLDKIMLIEEEQKFGPIEKTRVRMLFLDGFEVFKNVESVRWSWWKTSFLA